MNSKGFFGRNTTTTPLADCQDLSKERYLWETKSDIHKNNIYNDLAVFCRRIKRMLMLSAYIDAALNAEV